METRHLTTFLAIVERGGFTEAARRLGYSQSTVSAHIQALEETVGAPLFDRKGRRLGLTEEGSRLRALAEEMLALEARIGALGERGREPSGSLRVGAAESVTVARLGEVLALYRQSFPSVALSLTNASCAQIVEDVLKGETDLAALIMPLVRHPDLEVAILSREAMVFVGSARTERDALLRGLATGNLEEGFLFTEQGCSYRITVESLFRRQGLVPGRVMAFSSVEAIKRCVQSDMGLSFLPRLYIEEELREGTLRELEAPPLEEVFLIQLAWRKKRPLSAAARAFIDLARERALRWDGNVPGKGGEGDGAPPGRPSSPDGNRRGAA